MQKKFDRKFRNARTRVRNLSSSQKCIIVCYYCMHPQSNRGGTRDVEIFEKLCVFRKSKRFQQKCKFCDRKFRNARTRVRNLSSSHKCLIVCSYCMHPQSNRGDTRDVEFFRKPFKNSANGAPHAFFGIFCLRARGFGG